MKKTSFKFSLLNLEFSKREAYSAYANQTKCLSERHQIEPVKREEAPAKGCSEMPVTSRDSQAETPTPQKQKTSWKKVVLAIVIIVAATIIAIFSDNASLANEMLAKLSEIL